MIAIVKAAEDQVAIDRVQEDSVGPDPLVRIGIDQVMTVGRNLRSPLGAVPPPVVEPPAGIWLPGRR